MRAPITALPSAAPVDQRPAVHRDGGLGQQRLEGGDDDGVRDGTAALMRRQQPGDARARTQPTRAAGTAATGTQPRTRVPPGGPPTSRGGRRASRSGRACSPGRRRPRPARGRTRSRRRRPSSSSRVVRAAQRDRHRGARRAWRRSGRPPGSRSRPRPRRRRRSRPTPLVDDRRPGPGWSPTRGPQRRRRRRRSPSSGG